MLVRIENVVTVSVSTINNFASYLFQLTENGAFQLVDIMYRIGRYLYGLGSILTGAKVIKDIPLASCTFCSEP